jgi:hypothetical protein
VSSQSLPRLLGKRYPRPPRAGVFSSPSIRITERSRRTGADRDRGSSGGRPRLRGPASVAVALHQAGVTPKAGTGFAVRPEEAVPAGEWAACFCRWRQE